MTGRLLVQKFIVVALGLALLVSSGWSFYRSRHLPEAEPAGLAHELAGQVAVAFAEPDHRGGLAAGKNSVRSASSPVTTSATLPGASTTSTHGAVGADVAANTSGGRSSAACQPCR